MSILFLQKMLKCVMNAPREPVTSCLNETDTPHNQTTLYDVKTKSCNTGIVLK